MARILLVEDNDLNRDMLSRRLQRRGHEMLLAADGMQAILMAESETPDLVLLDMSLPVIDEADKLLGVVTVDDVIDLLGPQDWRPDPRRFLR